jgi:hypothetical protein
VRRAALDLVHASVARLQATLSPSARSLGRTPLARSRFAVARAHRKPG